MKILQIIPYFPPALGFGGPPEVAYQLAIHLKKLNHEIIVLTTTAGTDFKYTIIDNSYGFFVKYHRVSFPNYWKRCYGLDISLDEFIPNVDLVLIHTVFAYSTFVSITACKKYNKKYFLFAHGMFDNFALKKNSLFKSFYINLFVKPYAKNGTVIFNAFEEESNSSYGYLFSNTLVVPNGVDFSNFENLNEFFFDNELSCLSDKIVFLFLGRLDPKKGLDILVIAFCIFAKSYPDAFLLIGGPDYYNYQNNLEDSIKNFDTKNQIIFLGPVYGKDKFILFKSVYSFIQPSYYEGLSLSLLEAMASGLPIITSNKVGLHSKLKALDAALIINPTIDELLKALEKIYTDKVYSSNLGRNAKNIALSEHTWESISVKIQNLII